VALAVRYGLTARFMTDWEELPHKQSKLRVTRATELRFIAFTEPVRKGIRAWSAGGRRAGMGR
jgi:hypothetical protein